MAARPTQLPKPHPSSTCKANPRTFLLSRQLPPQARTWLPPPPPPAGLHRRPQVASPQPASAAAPQLASTAAPSRWPPSPPRAGLRSHPQLASPWALAIG
ncbi:hypothetical protein PVAP13_6NG108103 [Panicum virgatum]|uniref:Uncharacterized protein n=1 Tax=Panicum virgatum TaxID=38727 RepID=A0A8T0QY00_PANVG|nr:hypothetical protein PVAP13_6NG108103 [Panicum virgatum]